MILKKNLILLACILYKPPGNHPFLSQSQQFDSFLESYEDLLSKITNTETYICTDSNIDLLDINSSVNSKRFFELSASHGFLNIITNATRFSTHNQSLIDQVFTNSDKLIYDSGVLIQDISDHFFTFTKIKMSVKNNKPKPKITRSFSDQNIQLFKISISNLTWNEVLSCSTPDSGFDAFWDLFSTFFIFIFRRGKRHLIKTSIKFRAS